MFMLKSTHDSFVAALIRDRDYWHDEAKAAMQREREAMTRLIDHAPAPAITPRVKREPDEADTAIDWRSQGDPMLRRHLERFARGLRRDNVDAKDIAARIMSGDATPDDEDGVP